jgi:amino acid permease
LGSIAIAVNSLAGPAILQLPAQYQQSGLIPTTLCLVAVAVLSACCSLHMANTVSLVPGNTKFTKRVEFSDPFRIFWSERMYTVTQVLFFLTTVCLNIAAIVDTAETVDSFLGFYGWHRTTVAVSLDSPTGQHWQTWSHGGDGDSPHCTRRQVKLNQCEPFNDMDVTGNFLLTAGYVLTTLVFLPLCLADLKENTAWQIFGFGLLVSLSAYFCLDLSQYHLTLHHVSVWGDQWSDMMGVILFNFSLVLAVPAWLNEKKDSVSVRHTIVTSTAISTALYVSVGIIGALAIPEVNVNMLSPMLSGAFGSGIQVAASLFAFFIIGLDIPLFSVLARYNLTSSGLCSTRTANILVVWIPWSISWIFYTGNDIGALLAWGGVLLTSAVAFLLPLYLARLALLAQPVAAAAALTDSDDDDGDGDDSDDNLLEGSVNVYGDWCTTCLRMRHNRGAQLKALTVLVVIAAVAVATAIGGQFARQEHEFAKTHSFDYLNSSTIEELKRGVQAILEPASEALGIPLHVSSSPVGEETKEFLRKVGVQSP